MKNNSFFNKRYNITIKNLFKINYSAIFKKMNEYNGNNNISKKLFESRLQIKNSKSKNFFQQSIDNSKIIEKFSFITNINRPKISKTILTKPNSIYSMIPNSVSRNKISIINNISNNNNRKINSGSFLFKNKLLTFNKYSKKSQNSSKEKSFSLNKNVTCYRCKKNIKCKTNSNIIFNTNPDNKKKDNKKIEKNNTKKKCRPIAIYIDNPFKRRNNLSRFLYKKHYSYNIENKNKIPDLERFQKTNSLPNNFKNKHNDKIAENLQRKIRYLKKIPNVKNKKGINSNKNSICRNLNKKIFNVKLKYSKEISCSNNISSMGNIKNKILELSKRKITKKPTSKNSKDKKPSIKKNFKSKIFDFSCSIKDLKLNKDKKGNKNYKTIPIQKNNEADINKKNKNPFLLNNSNKNKNEKSCDSSSSSGILTMGEVRDIIIYNDMSNIKRNQNFIFFFNDYVNFIKKNNLWLGKLFFKNKKNSKEIKNRNSIEK